MTASEFFEKQKRLNQIEKDITYEDWLQNRIEKNLPVEGDLMEAHDNITADKYTMNVFSDRLNLRAIFPTKRETEAEKKAKEDKEEKTTEIKVRFIKKKK